MLGSAQDAEDALHGALLAAWQALAGFEGRASIRTWLYRAVTSRCLNAQERHGLSAPHLNGHRARRCRVWSQMPPGRRSDQPEARRWAVGGGAGVQEAVAMPSKSARSSSWTGLGAAAAAESSSHPGWMGPVTLQRWVSQRGGIVVAAGKVPVGMLLRAGKAVAVSVTAASDSSAAREVSIGPASPGSHRWAVSSEAEASPVRGRARRPLGPPPWRRAAPLVRTCSRKVSGRCRS